MSELHDEIFCTEKDYIKEDIRNEFGNLIITGRRIYYKNLAIDLSSIRAVEYTYRKNERNLGTPSALLLFSLIMLSISIYYTVHFTRYLSVPWQFFLSLGLGVLFLVLTVVAAVWLSKEIIKNQQSQQGFLEIDYGNDSQEIEIKGSKEILVQARNAILAAKDELVYNVKPTKNIYF